MNIEIRTDGVLHIDGYVNAVERDSREINTKEGRCVERVLAGVFGKALSVADEVRMLLNHNANRQLASTKDTLSLEEDAIGLRAIADITDEEVIEKARLGKLKGWSFGFKAKQTEMEQRMGQLPRRILKDIDLFEVSIIDDEHNPCYNSTSLNFEFRSEGDAELRYDDEVSDAYEKKWKESVYLPKYYELKELRSKGLELDEVRFNAYHDANDGRFTDSEGGGSGGVVYSKGGKSYYRQINKGYSDAEIDEMYENSQKGNVKPVIEKTAGKRIKSNPVSELKEKLTSEQIVDKVGGGDDTRGSCSSVALTYIANENGLDALDFRGGTSRTFFADTDNVKSIVEASGGKVFDQVGTKETISYLKENLPEGENYYFATGRHAAIIRNNGGNLEYLELQSGFKGGNGFKPLGSFELYDRFGAAQHTSKHMVIAQDDNGNYLRDENGRAKVTMEYPKSFLVSSSKLGKSEGFKDLMSYINTKESAQKKSARGGIK